MVMNNFFFSSSAIFFLGVLSKIKIKFKRKRSLSIYFFVSQFFNSLLWTSDATEAARQWHSSENAFLYWNLRNTFA